MMRVALGLALCLATAACSPFYRIPIPESATADAPRSKDGKCENLAPFWRANGFRQSSKAFSFGSVPRCTAGAVALATWEKWYEGLVFPYSGNVTATEASQGGQCVVYIYPLSRNQEAGEVAENLRRYLSLYHPEAAVKVEKTCFLDLR
jgi:hypothetical protein